MMTSTPPPPRSALIGVALALTLAGCVLETEDEPGAAPVALLGPVPLDSSGSLAGHGTERLGTDVAFAGSELLMGAPSEASWEDQNDYDDDVAWVTVGGRAAFVSQRTALDDEWHDLVDGAGPARSAPDNQFGASVLAPGDVTGDGVDDLMVG